MRKEYPREVPYGDGGAVHLVFVHMPFRILLSHFALALAPC